MRRDNAEESDLERSWRQTARWLVSDVPSRVEVSVRPKAESSAPAIELAVRVRDAEYRSLDNAKVALKITLPDGGTITLDAEPDGLEAGLYATTYVTKQAGAYRVVATATGPDGALLASERPAGPPSPPPTSSPAWHQTGTSWRPSPRRPGAKSWTATDWTRSSRASPRAERPSRSSGRRRSGIIRFTS